MVQAHSTVLLEENILAENKGFKRKHAAFGLL
jgi:hypothetical protein